MKSEEYLNMLVTETSKNYHAQPAGKRNAQAAAIHVLDRHNVQDPPIRKSFLSKICTALGKNGGAIAAAKRKQLSLF